MVSLNCSNVGSSMSFCRKLIQVFDGARKEAVLVEIRGCTESGETKMMLTSCSSAFLCQVIWKRVNYLVVEDLVHHDQK